MARLRVRDDHDVPGRVRIHIQDAEAVLTARICYWTSVFIGFHHH